MKKKKELKAKEFVRKRAIRDLIRIGIVFAALVVDRLFIGNYILPIAVGLIMLGWRIQAGW
jgi:hypothetical protein